MMSSLRSVLAVAGVLLFASAGSLHAADYTARAQALLAKGDPRAAMIELRNAIKQNPNDAAAHYALAKLDLSLGDPVGAEREARAARDHGYNAGEALSLLLDTYLAQARYKDLLADFPAGNTDPDLAARIAVGRGRAELGLNQPDRAAADFAKAAELAPHAIEPLLAQADLEMVQRHLDAARKTLDKAAAIDPHAQPVLLRQATLLIAAGKAKDAVAVLETAHQAAPGDPSVRLALANALINAGETDKAAAEVKAALAIVPGSVQGMYLQAVLLVRAGHYQEASALLQKLSPVLPRLPEAYLLQATVMEQLGQWAAAEDATQHFLSRFPTDPRGQRLLATIKLHAGQPAAALAALQSLPPAERSDPVSIELMGRAHLGTGNLAAAQSEFAAAAKLAPKFEAPLTGLAAVHLRSGDLAGAIRAYQNALALAPGDAATRRELIVAAMSSGQYDLAQTNLAILDKQDKGAVPDALLRAQLQLAQLDMTGARDTYAAILRAHPETIPAMLGLARIAALQGDQKEQQQRLTAALAQDPTNLPALSSLAALFVGQGKPDDARTLLEHAHASAPANASVTALLAAFDMHMKTPDKALDVLATANTAGNVTLLGLQAGAELAAGKRDAAIETVRRVLARQPGSAATRLTLARLLNEEKDFDGARAVLNEGLASQPRNAGLMEGLIGVALAEHGPDAALAEARTLAADASHQPESRALVGDFYVARHQPADAAAAYATAFAADPSTDVLTRLANALQAAGKPEEAASRLSAYLAAHPDAAPVALLLASLEIQAGQLDAAAGHLETVIHAQPNNAVALNNLAWIKGKQGKPEALELAQRAYFLSGDSHIADTLGWIITQQKPSRTGVVLLQQAHAAAPNDPTVAYHLADALAATGDDQAAAALLRPIVTGPTTFADKQAASALLEKISGRP